MSYSTVVMSFSIGVRAYNTEHELNNKLELADKTCT